MQTPGIYRKIQDKKLLYKCKQKLSQISEYIL